MAAIEPGDRFTIVYGRDKKRLEVVALNGRQRRRCMQCLANTKEARTPDAVLAVWDELAEVTKLCVPDMTDELMDTLDDALQVEIITATVLKTAISEDEAKKSE